MHRLLTILIALVWLINGLYCKVLNLVPRHQHIVSEILGDTNSVLFTRMIGIGEVLMGILILTGYQSRKTALLQILLVAVMNVLEFILVPELLLFGRWNAVVALAFIFLIWYNQKLQIKKLQLRPYGIPA